MNPRRQGLAAIMSAASIAVLAMDSASGQPTPPRAEPPPRIGVSSPPSHGPQKGCTGGTESADHKSATKVICFRVGYSNKSSDVRDKNGDEGDVKRVSCAAPVKGKRTCTLIVEVNERR